MVPTSFWVPDPVRSSQNLPTAGRIPQQLASPTSTFPAVTVHPWSVVVPTLQPNAALYSKLPFLTRLTEAASADWDPQSSRTPATSPKHDHAPFLAVSIVF